eukprot:5231908-Amphidinium_carterae.1
MAIAMEQLRAAVLAEATVGAQTNVVADGARQCVQVWETLTQALSHAERNSKCVGLSRFHFPSTALPRPSKLLQRHRTTQQWASRFKNKNILSNEQKLANVSSGQFGSQTSAPLGAKTFLLYRKPERGLVIPPSTSLAFGVYRTLEEWHCRLRGN